jgi:hypothetical protein
MSRRLLLKGSVPVLSPPDFASVSCLEEMVCFINDAADCVVVIPAAKSSLQAAVSKPPLMLQVKFPEELAKHSAPGTASLQGTLCSNPVSCAHQTVFLAAQVSGTHCEAVAVAALDAEALLAAVSACCLVAWQNEFLGHLMPPHITSAGSHGICFPV